MCAEVLIFIKRIYTEVVKMMDHYIELEKVLTRMTEDSYIVKKTVNRARKDRLLISKSGTKLMFFCCTGKNESRVMKLINSDKPRIYRLAHKAYNKELSERLQANTELLKETLKKMYPLEYRSMLDSLPKHFDQLDPKYVENPGLLEFRAGWPNPSRDEYPRQARLTIGHFDPIEWACLPYCENTSYLEYKIHATSRGVICRSKSEVAILEKYDALGIPYHYDEVVRIGMDTLSPDVIGVRRDGSLIYHEHCGLIESEEYYAHILWKLSVYASAGIILGKNLILTFDDENNALNMKLAEEQIRSAYWM